jgi:hypothetical protein
MKMVNLRVWIVIAALLSASLAWSQEFYRYKNEDGRTVLDTKIPGQYVNNGYDVLDSSGRLIETVPPVVQSDSSEIEQASQNANQALADQVLLTSYSTVEEIDAHRLRKVQALEREINIIETDKRVTQIEIDKAVAEKADYEARNFEVPAEVIEHIDELNLAVVNLDEQLKRRSDEIVAIDNEFIGKMDRFRQLKAELEAQ